MNKAVFFDRDGVVNIDTGYVYRIKDFIYTEGIFSLLQFCKNKGYLLILVTNQSGISRGLYNHDDFDKLSNFIQNDLLQKIGCCFDKIYHCPHAVESNCKCRKPKSGMIDLATLEFDINPNTSYIIGDKESDIEAGINGNIGTKILFNKDITDSKADFIVNRLFEIENIII